MTTKKNETEDTRAETTPAAAAAPTRYEVLHIFGHEGEAIGPWNEEKVAELPAETLAAVVKLRYVRALD
jgi:hypothetical protein